MDPSMLPVHTDVARLLRARTKSPSGVELGDFTGETRPTAEQVGELIDQAARDVDAATGGAIPDDAARIAQHVVTLRAALLVELSYFPEQVRQEQSAYAEFKDLYDQALRNLNARLANNTPRGNRIHNVPVRGLTGASAACATDAWYDLRPTPLNPAYPLAGADVVMVQAPGEGES